MIPDGSSKGLTEFREFFLTDPADRGHQFEIGRTLLGHEPERHIREDDIGRHIPLVGECAPESSECIEELLVADDFTSVERSRAGAGCCGANLRNRFGQADLASIFECGQSYGTQFYGVKAAVC